MLPPVNCVCQPGGIAVPGDLFSGAPSPELVEHRFSSCGTRAYLLCGMWDLFRPGIKPVSPALAGRFFITEPPGKPNFFSFLKNSSKIYIT